MKPDLSLEEPHQGQENEESQELQGEGTACAKAQRDEMQIHQIIYVPLEQELRLSSNMPSALSMIIVQWILNE